LKMWESRGGSVPSGRGRSINPAMRLRRRMMSSEIIVALILVALAVGSLIWLERHSRRNKRKEETSETAD